MSLTLGIALSTAMLPGSPILWPLNGAHVTFKTGIDSASKAPGLLAGEIHGSIKNTDVQSIVVPAFAGQLTTLIQQNPNSARAMSLSAVFDTGGCGQAQARDQKIDPCEVAQSPLFAQGLAPDVQIFDGSGNYAPSPGNAKKDSISLGIGFTAVKASF